MSRRSRRHGKRRDYRQLAAVVTRTRRRVVEDEPAAASTTPNDVDTHQNSRDTDTAPTLTPNTKPVPRRPRRTYRCKLCGQPKKGHVCTARAIPAPTNSSASPVNNMSSPTNKQIRSGTAHGHVSYTPPVEKQIPSQPSTTPERRKYASHGVRLARTPALGCTVKCTWKPRSKRQYLVMKIFIRNYFDDDHTNIL